MKSLLGSDQDKFLPICCSLSKTNFSNNFTGIMRTMKNAKNVQGYLLESHASNFL